MWYIILGFKLHSILKQISSVLAKNIGATCDDATDFCLGNSQCLAGTCDCPDGQQVYTGVEGQCLPTGLSPIGGECTQDSNCLGRSFSDWTILLMICKWGIRMGLLQKLLKYQVQN